MNVLRLIAATGVSLVALTANAASDITEQSLEGCKIVAADAKNPTPTQSMKTGMCFGALQAALDTGALLQWNKAWCTPPNTSRKQMIEQWVKWTKAHPTEMAKIDSAMGRILTALPDIYPCKDAKK
ncbi:Rap1a/Tai family immunity protein [Pseudomonas aeruginosa]|uniref:Rap1a/Tai family immunity protein n=1 Tax=Pseudomonas aeruginosa TaxID=287 RepID=UPI0021F23251|nr:Rap1a/Tai family immunity protein [Pseudomonas aeruginosa]MCV6105123.1 Rap1a/Tai family immunity protein [Pseudomonas aeruginosa]MDI2202480.1 Rap1a/Tai family immunity protein [Pseudomonas aeruginosa]MDY1166144.1 Rap1a/Tai family immunity protein [Pseudomonas aeruginosa]HBO4605230.1 hypothetical protein [Pseudomonas aeruginosa]